MDCCDTIKRDNNSVYSRLKEQKESIETKIDKNILKIQNVLTQCEDGADVSNEEIQIIMDEQAKLQESLNKISTTHKALHSTVSRIGKSIDKVFQVQSGSLMPDSDFNADDADLKVTMNSVIVRHLNRLGLTRVSRTMEKEANVHHSIYQTEEFCELYRICQSLQKKQLDPALQWIVDHKHQLERIDSSLGFLFNRVRYVQLLKQSQELQNVDEQLLHMDKMLRKSRIMASYVRPGDNTKDLMHLMGAVMFCNNKRLAGSPYGYLIVEDDDVDVDDGGHGDDDGDDLRPCRDLSTSCLNSKSWQSLIDAFTVDACRLLDVPLQSLLAIVVDTGCIAIQPLLNIKQVMEKRRCSEVWNNKNELPVDIELSDRNRYHSVFACPILRQQGTPTNQPVRLVCGHAISKDALTKLAGTSQKRRTNLSKDKPLSVKCPYCPIEQTISESKIIHF